MSSIRNRSLDKKLNRRKVKASYKAKREVRKEKTELYKKKQEELRNVKVSNGQNS